MVAKIKKIIPLVLFLTLLVFIVGCSGGAVMSSGWYEGVVEIDGYEDDWAGLWGFPEESPVTFAVKNHDETFYLAFSTHDPKVIRQAAFGGFAIILDSKGGRTGATACVLKLRTLI